MTDNPWTSQPRPIANTDAERMAVTFTRLLRMADLNVPVGCGILFAEALGAVGMESRDAVYWAGRSTLLRQPEDQPIYDRAFAAFWLQRRDDSIHMEAEPDEIAILLDTDDEGGSAESDDDDGEEISPDDILSVRYSDTEVLANKDFAAYSPAELAEAHRLMAEMRFTSATRRSRREQRSKRNVGQPDLRRTVRRALRTGGEPIQRHHREPGRQPRRLVVILDVSGSMETYARALLRFVQAAVVSRRRVEAFALGTRLTRMTRELSSRDPDRALAAASDAVTDWSGGTRLGEGLREFNDRWGIRGMARGSVVVILSDGWDRGDPEDLATEMERLSRVTHRLIWVNPLKASPGYAPLARGMAAALPFVDQFIEGHSIRALEDLAALVSAENTSRRGNAGSGARTRVPHPSPDDTALQMEKS